jgi:hypothetical protein
VPLFLPFHSVRGTHLSQPHRLQLSGRIYGWIPLADLLLVIDECDGLCRLLGDVLGGHYFLLPLAEQSRRLS